MADNQYMSHQEGLGTIQISNDVVASIATSAAQDVEGVGGLMNANVTDLVGGKKLSARGVRVEMVDDGLAVSLFLMLRYGFSVTDVAGKVQQAVYAALEGMTGFHVTAVNVHVGGVCFE